MRLRQMIQLWMRVNEVGVRQLAKDLGLSPATVSRFLGGKPVELPTAVKILSWMVDK